MTKIYEFSDYGVYNCLYACFYEYALNNGKLLTFVDWLMWLLHCFFPLWSS